MERKGPRSAKPKNVPLPGNLITLGSKSGRPDQQIDKSSSHGTTYASGKPSGNLVHRNTILILVFFFAVRSEFRLLGSSLS